MILDNARIVTDDGRSFAGWLRTEGALIAEKGTGPAPQDGMVHDLGGRWLGPGFIDGHIHGGYGVDVMHATAEQIAVLSAALLRHGVTSYLPTSYTASPADTLRALGEIERARVAARDGARILGVHMEGPFLSAARKGAHPEEELRDGSPEELAALLDAARVLIVTLAPERPGGAALIPVLRARGVVVSLGHSDARFDEAQRAVREGAGLVTHLFNGMAPYHHRASGLLGAALLTPELVCELIADGVHVDREGMRLAWLAKGRAGIALVSDAGRAADGRREAGEAMHLADGTLASSALMIDEGLRRFRDANELGIPEAWGLAGATVATVLGLDDVGSLAPGCRADLVVLGPGGDVEATLVGGRLLHGTLGAA